jgi:hypothetical protein
MEHPAVSRFISAVNGLAPEGASRECFGMHHNPELMMCAAISWHVTRETVHTIPTEVLMELAEALNGFMAHTGLTGGEYYVSGVSPDRRGFYVRCDTSKRILEECREAIVSEVNGRRILLHRYRGSLN